MKKVKKVIAVLLIVMMTSVMLTGCGDNGKIVVTVSGEKITKPLYRLYLWTIQQQFESLTPNIWDMDLEGKKTEEVAKDRALDSIKVSVAAKQKAKELGIKLSSEEKATVKTNAKEIMEGRTDLVDKIGIKQNDVETFLSYGLLIDKVTQKISESYVPNEDETKEEMDTIREQYQTATAKHVLIKTVDDQNNPLPQENLEQVKNLAEEVLNKALAGEDMSELAKTYSEDPRSKETGGEYTFGKGQMVAEFESVAFVTGKVGEVYPELVQTSYGYHIMKVESRHEGTEDEIKLASQERIKARFAQTELSELAENMKIEKKEVYDTIHILSEEAETTTIPEGVESK